MKHTRDILAYIERVAANLGTTPDKLLRRVTGDPRRYARLKARAAQMDALVAAVTAYAEKQTKK